MRLDTCSCSPLPVERIVKRTALPGGELEYAVLSALIDAGRATVREVHERIGKRGDLAYTTTAKVLDRLHDKGLVKRERVGIALSYASRISRATLERARAKEMLLRLLAAAPEPAVAGLVDAAESISPELLDRLARAVQERRKARRGT
jgi:predicted transcriptional regulator